jgi:epoxyqueuosine reductase QueG
MNTPRAGRGIGTQGKNTLLIARVFGKHANIGRCLSMRPLHPIPRLKASA